MNKPTISIISAVAKNNRAIGKDNKLLWHIPEDFKWFKEKTKDHTVILGMNTFESIGKPLPKRTNIVITHLPDYQPEGVIVVHSFNEALEEAKKYEKEEIFVLGGAYVYSQAIDLADKLYITEVEGDFEADTFFPDYSHFNKELYRKPSQSDDHKYTFLILQKN